MGIMNNPIPKNGRKSANEIKNALLIGCSNCNNAKPQLNRKNVTINNWKLTNKK
ncbi:hypothetical protein MTP04_27080 [Lysinibacillus sp. PLM2]|nr:hypothetical protein MTP04_27080 [Lysinibacillus sp. PLM2]